jgi:outer membrane protein assembly factor BamB
VYDNGTVYFNALDAHTHAVDANTGEKTAMPNVHLGDEDARDIACYLYTLR